MILTILLLVVYIGYLIEISLKSLKSLNFYIKMTKNQQKCPICESEDIQILTENTGFCRKCGTSFRIPNLFANINIVKIRKNK